jgi:transposase InsO family protein
MDEIALRKEAVRLHLTGETTAAISRTLGKSRDWVRTWINRYNPDAPEDSLQNHTSTPKHPHRKWAEALIQQAVTSRKLRMEASEPGYKYALIGAQAIHYELKALGISPVPPVRTTHTWLQRAGLIQPETPEEVETRPSKPYPQPSREQVNDLQQLDLKGPFYLSGGSQKYYLLALRDFVSKRVALDVAKDHTAATVAAFLVQAWQRIGMPQVLQMDNGLELWGSNRYPRSFGKVVHICLDLDVEPCFVPPREPWRNGFIENCNGLVGRLLLKQQTIANFAELQSCVQELEEAINASHRLEALSGKTPNEYTLEHRLRLLDPDYDGHQRNLQLEKGNISFIRMVRRSGRITLCANDKFEIGSEFQWQYVLARVDVKAQSLAIYVQSELVKELDYPMRE